MTNELLFGRRSWILLEAVYCARVWTLCWVCPPSFFTLMDHPVASRPLNPQQCSERDEHTNTFGSWQNDSLHPVVAPQKDYWTSVSALPDAGSFTDDKHKYTSKLKTYKCLRRLFKPLITDESRTGVCVLKSHSRIFLHWTWCYPVFPVFQPPRNPSCFIFSCYFQEILN